MENTITEYTVLFTSQKQKKAKTWQDGILKYYSFNTKAALYDEKGFSVDNHFLKSKRINVGDELEFERTLVTIEAINRIIPAPTSYGNKSQTEVETNSLQGTQGKAAPSPVRQKLDDRSKGHRSRDPFRKRDLPESSLDANPGMDLISYSPSKRTLKSKEPLEVGEDLPPYALVTGCSANGTNAQSRKRRKIGLTRPNSSSGVARDLPSLQDELTSPSQGKVSPYAPTEHLGIQTEDGGSPRRSLHAITNTLDRPRQRHPSAACATQPSNYRSPSLGLTFPSAQACANIMKSTKSPVRTLKVGHTFSTPLQYQIEYSRLLTEHLQVFLTKVAHIYHVIRAQGKPINYLRANLTSRGIGYYDNVRLSRKEHFGQCSTQPETPNQHNKPNDLFTIHINALEHYSNYSKDDIWALSRSQDFEAMTTFLVRSAGYGPNTSGFLDVIPLFARDCQKCKENVGENALYGLRAMPASAELMMLDALNSTEWKSPILSSLLHKSVIKCPVNGNKGFKAPVILPNECSRLVINSEYGINVSREIKQTVSEFGLNEDQERVLTAWAKLTIACPEWDEAADSKVLLVHGVFGAGKSYLIAVLILFLQRLKSKVSLTTGKSAPGKILITSMTNVAVDRILGNLIDLGYKEFLRVGSVKKVAKSILPYIVKAKIGKEDEIKELESILSNESLYAKEKALVQEALAGLRSRDSHQVLSEAGVVGVTCMASTFEILNETDFPIVIIDEASQIAEPMAMVPISRSNCERLVLVGDPQQLPPPLQTSSDPKSEGKGLDKTIFNRLMEMGISPIMLRTQYRCHPDIANLSNDLFYGGMLINGVSTADRSPILPQMAAISVVGVRGVEKQVARSNSYLNERERDLTIAIVRACLREHVSPNDIGIISLYKSQTDAVRSAAEAQISEKKLPQISTVDAFQGAEKDIIILSTVRSSRTQFLDSRYRVNVAITRAKRHLIILGHMDVFQASDIWSHIVERARNQGNYYTEDRLLQLLGNLESAGGGQDCGPKDSLDYNANIFEEFDQSGDAAPVVPHDISSKDCRTPPEHTAAIESNSVGWIAAPDEHLPETTSAKGEFASLLKNLTKGWNSDDSKSDDESVFDTSSPVTNLHNTSIDEDDLDLLEC